MSHPLPPSRRSAPSLRTPILAAGELRELVHAQVASRTADLPVLPAAAMEALRLVRSPRMHTDALLAVVEQDPPLAARILAVANSSFYVRGAPVLSLRQAVVRLGLHALRDVIYMAIYANTVFDSPGLVDAVRESFDHSVLTARIAQRIAPLTGLDAETSFLAGLLHDVGRARCLKVLAKLPQARSADPDHVYEVVTSLHEEAGATLARAWNLPDEVVDACAHHHAPTSDLARLVCAADRAAHALETPPRATDEEAEAAIVALGVEPAEAGELLFVLRTELPAKTTDVG